MPTKLLGYTALCSAGSTTDPAEGPYSAPLTPLLDLRGPTSKRREGPERPRGAGEVREGNGLYDKTVVLNNIIFILPES